jgi:hypothetical protein
MHAMRAFTLIALATIAGLAGAAELPGLELPPKSPVAKRLRKQADAKWELVRPVHEAFRKNRGSENKVDPETVRDAVANAEEAIYLYEKAQRAEWSTPTNQTQMQCVRAWADMHTAVPEEEAPTDPEALKKWQNAKTRARAERLRDARRVLGKLESLRHHNKVFVRCNACDGRGEMLTRFGGQPGEKAKKRTCRTCAGGKVLPHRKRILDGYWFAFSPFYRNNGRNRSGMNYVLRTGARGEKRLAPYIMTSRIMKKPENHGWWVKFDVVQKVHDDPKSRKGVERKLSIVMVNIGRVWWVHDSIYDRDLLQIPEEPKEKN